QFSELAIPVWRSHRQVARPCVVKHPNSLVAQRARLATTDRLKSSRASALSRVALVKPDHLGDLILSAPAIRAAQLHFGQITLFVSDSTRSLAQFLFPDVELASINFPHLARNNKMQSDLQSVATALNRFELVLWL